MALGSLNPSALSEKTNNPSAGAEDSRSSQSCAHCPTEPTVGSSVQLEYPIVDHRSVHELEVTELPPVQYNFVARTGLDYRLAGRVSLQIN